MLLPERLKTIASFIKPNEIVADVGADHGLLELCLITRDTGNYIVAIENKKGPYNILKENLICLKNIRLSYSNGLEAVDPSVEVVVLAGMGGINIVNILNKYPKKVKKLKRIIVDAHRNEDAVRKNIVSYGFEIVKEQIVFENKKFYIISVFEKSDKDVTYSEDEYLFGYKINEDPLWNEYKKYILEKNTKNLQNITTEKRKAEVENYIKRLTNYGKN